MLEITGIQQVAVRGRYRVTSVAPLGKVRVVFRADSSQMRISEATRQVGEVSDA